MWLSYHSASPVPPVTHQNIVEQAELTLLGSLPTHLPQQALTNEDTTRDQEDLEKKKKDHNGARRRGRDDKGGGKG